MEIGEQELVRQRWSGGAPFAVYFYTPLCGTCRVGKKMVDVVQAMERGMDIFEANVNVMPQVVQDWKIESVPCLAFVSEKRIAGKLYAMRSVPFLLEEVRKHMDANAGG